SGTAAAGGDNGTGSEIRNVFGSTVILKNTIVVNPDSSSNCDGGITDGGNNLDNGTSCGFSAANSSQSSANANLAALADNGGPTMTFALTGDSDAIDAGDNTACAAASGSPDFGADGVDQRGVSRPIDGNNDSNAVCDIGAYEAPSNTFET